MHRKVLYHQVTSTILKKWIGKKIKPWSESIMLYFRSFEMALFDPIRLTEPRETDWLNFLTHWPKRIDQKAWLTENDFSVEIVLVKRIGYCFRYPIKMWKIFSYLPYAWTLFILPPGILRIYPQRGSILGPLACQA